ncbi:YjgN family protein [Photobacterium sanguinicancri]|uniref:YjgN family protein n=1 Tax=Photobacterium sanguinicancri TaxID=875932 RepID=UPI0024804205|nr:YjgN family protein [Photobacterium sanguinicancri]
MDNQIKFYGQGREFFGIWFVNLLLSVVTIGIYSAWAKVRTKKYFYGNTDLAGDRFDYHAKPIQILKGRMVAMLFVLIWFVCNQLFPTLSLLLMLIFILLAPWLIHSNTRFDARMTSFRNVHFNFTGSVKSAYNVFLFWPLICAVLIACCLLISAAIGGSSWLGGLIVSGLSLLLGFVLFCWVSAEIASYFVNGYHYGSCSFSGKIDTKQYVTTYLQGAVLATVLTALMVGTGIALFGYSFHDISNSGEGIAANGGDFTMIFAIFSSYIVFILIMLITSGFIQARLRNYIFSEISIKETAEYGLISRMTTKGLITLMLSNFILLVVSVGFARPWVMVRTAKYVASVTAVQGDLNALTVEGDTLNASSAVADELAEAFDLNIGIG